MFISIVQQNYKLTYTQQEEKEDKEKKNDNNNSCMKQYCNTRIETNDTKAIYNAFMD